METEIAPEKTVVTESAAEALPVVETVKTEASTETATASTLEDFANLTVAQQREVRRELEKLNDAKNEAAKGRGNLYPGESKGGKGKRVGDFPKGKSPEELAAKVEAEKPKEEPTKAEPEAKVEVAAKETPEGEETDEDKKDPQMRVRPKTQRERDVIALMRGGRSMDEAIAMLGGAPKAVKETPAKDEPPIEATFDKEISTLQTEITALEKQQEAAAEEADVAKALKIARQITAKERAIENKQMAKEMAVSQQQQEVAQTAAQKEADIVNADHASVLEDYPELGDKTSAERKKFEEFIRERQNDPRYEGKFASLHWRSALAHEFAAKTGLKPAALRTAFEPPATAVKTAPAKTTPPPAVKTASQASAAKALTTKDSPSSETFELTPEQAVKDFADLTVQQQREVMRELEKLQRAKSSRAA